MRQDWCGSTPMQDQEQKAGTKFDNQASEDWSAQHLPSQRLLRVGDRVVQRLILGLDSGLNGSLTGRGYELFGGAQRPENRDKAARPRIRYMKCMYKYNRRTRRPGSRTIQVIQVDTSLDVVLDSI